LTTIEAYRNILGVARFHHNKWRSRVELGSRNQILRGGHIMPAKKKAAKKKKKK
jgi:hypothetical protein